MLLRQLFRRLVHGLVTAERAPVETLAMVFLGVLIILFITHLNLALIGQASPCLSIALVTPSHVLAELLLNLIRVFIGWFKVFLAKATEESATLLLVTGLADHPASSVCSILRTEALFRIAAHFEIFPRSLCTDEAE